jgi:hypothetical protein
MGIKKIQEHGRKLEKRKRMIRLIDLLEEVVVELDEKYKTKGSLGKWLRQKWVDISRKDKKGTHPPCGASAGKKERGKSGSRAYPKCRPARSAAAMSSKEKRSAITRKRKAGNPGGTPVMVKTHAKSN